MRSSRVSSTSPASFSERSKPASAVRSSAMSFVDFPSGDVQVDHREYERDDDEDVADGGALAEEKLDERLLVSPGRERLRRVGGPATRQAEDDVDHFQRVDDT